MGSFIHENHYLKVTFSISKIDKRQFTGFFHTTFELSICSFIESDDIKYCTLIFFQRLLILVYRYIHPFRQLNDSLHMELLVLHRKEKTNFLPFKKFNKKRSKR